MATQPATDTPSESDWSHIEIRVESTPSEYAVLLSGEWDIASDGLAGAQIKKELQEFDDKLTVVDLTGLEFAGPEAVRFLGAMGDQLNGDGRSLIVRLPSDGPVRRLFEIAAEIGLDGSIHSETSD